MASRNRFCRQYLQKVNAKCPHISDEKDKFCSIWWIFFNPFFKGSKVICQRGKTLFFHQKSEGILHLLFAGNTLKFERLKISSEIKGNFKLDGNVLEIALWLYSAPLIWNTKNNSSLQKSRAITAYFWDEVISLSMPSDCPPLTTVYLCTI